MPNKLLNSIKHKVNNLNDIPSLKSEITNLKQSINELKVLQGKQLAVANRNRIDSIIDDINEAEFKVFSQWGDDGIIQFLIEYLEIKNKTFIEFGVENYTESNTRFLLINNNWKGLIFDASEENINQIRSSDLCWKYQLTVQQSFITKENINQLFSSNNYKGEIGLLVVDIDGNDYWVWQAINTVQPIIVIVEFNSLLGSERAISIPYKADFTRKKAHFSNLYYGASLPALCYLATIKGYIFIGCNANGNNAYFIRKDKAKNLKVVEVKKGYKQASFKESRTEKNTLSYLNYNDAKELIKGLPVINVVNSAAENL
jgi:hypothetical protein